MSKTVSTGAGSPIGSRQMRRLQSAYVFTAFTTHVADGITTRPEIV